MTAVEDELRQLRERDELRRQELADTDDALTRSENRCRLLREELDAARVFQLALAERVAVCSELLSRRAER